MIVLNRILLALLVVPVIAFTWIALRPQVVPGPPGTPSPAVPPVPRDPGVVVLVADAWPPYNCQPGTASEGYVIDLVRAALAPAYRVEYRMVPWKRAVDSVRSGGCDGAVCASAGDGEGLVFPAQEIGRAVATFIVRTGTAWRFTGIESLSQVRLGAIDGYDYRPEIDAWIAGHRDDPQRVQLVDSATGLEQNLRKLIQGRVDTILECEVVARWEARRIGLADRIEVAGVFGEQKPLYVAFTPDERGRALAAALDAGIIRLRADGSLARILSAYGVVDWPQPGKVQ